MPNGKDATPKDRESRSVPEKRLSEKEMRFCYHFIALDNGKLAAMEAGYTDNENSACVIAHKLLKRPKIKKFIKKLFEAEIGPAKILAQQMIRETKAIALGNIDDVGYINDHGSFNLYPTKDVGRDKLRAVQSYTETTNEMGGSLSVKMHDKLKAIDTMMKYLKLFEEDTDGLRKDTAREVNERERICDILRKHSKK